MESELEGGNVTTVARVGDTVRRQVAPWTPTVHALLHYLEKIRFEGVPRARGIDNQGREILTFIEGEAGFISREILRPPDIWSDAILIEAARFLRRFHDATDGFRAELDAPWQMTYPDATAWEVICHNDFAPYNCIFQGGHLTGIIDFDTAGPGPRVWDVAYAAYRFVPLKPEAARAAIGVPAGIDLADRLRQFCDAYGLDHQQRYDLPLVIEERIQATRAMILKGATTGVSGYQRLLAEGGHIEGLDRDMAFVHRHAHDLREVLGTRR